MRQTLLFAALVAVLIGAVAVVITTANRSDETQVAPVKARRPTPVQLPGLRARWAGNAIELYVFNDSAKNDIYFEEGLTRVWLSDGSTKVDVPLARLVADLPSMLRPGEKARTARIKVPANFGRNAKLCFGYFEPMMTMQTEKEVQPESAEGMFVVADRN